MDLVNRFIHAKKWNIGRTIRRSTKWVLCTCKTISSGFCDWYFFLLKRECSSIFFYLSLIHQNVRPQITRHTQIFIEVNNMQIPVWFCLKKETISYTFFCHLFVAIPAFAFPIQQLPLIVYNYASFDFGCVFVLLSKSPDWYFPNDGVVEIDKMSINKNSCRLATMLRTAKSHEPPMNKYLRLKKCQCEAMEKEHKIAWIINSPFWKLLCCLHIVRRSLSLCEWKNTFLIVSIYRWQ